MHFNRDLDLINRADLLKQMKAAARSFEGTGDDWDKFAEGFRFAMDFVDAAPSADVKSSDIKP